MGWVITLQGSSGDISRSLPPKSREPRLATLRQSLDLGIAALKVREMENCLHFNVGKGSVLTIDGMVEMEASIMDVKSIVNAISLARLVMEKRPHIYFAFDGAEAFARTRIMSALKAKKILLNGAIRKGERLVPPGRYPVTL